LTYLTRPELQPAPVALRNYVDATNGASWGSLFAMSVVTLIQVFIEVPRQDRPPGAGPPEAIPVGRSHP
jgi:ABC-type glycerol-3-phosphate transport system permease component